MHDCEKGPSCWWTILSGHTTRKWWAAWPTIWTKLHPFTCLRGLTIAGQHSRQFAKQASTCSSNNTYFHPSITYLLHCSNRHFLLTISWTNYESSSVRLQDPMNQLVTNNKTFTHNTIFPDNSTWLQFWQFGFPRIRPSSLYFCWVLSFLYLQQFLILANAPLFFRSPPSRIR